MRTNWIFFEEFDLKPVFIQKKLGSNDLGATNVNFVTEGDFKSKF